MELIVSIRPHEIRTLGSAIQVMLCSKGAAKTPEYPACYRLAFIRQYYLDSTTRQGWKRSWATACRNAKLEDLRFHDLRHTFVTRKVREDWDYKRIMAITGHKTFAVFQRYNNPTEEDLRAVVTTTPQPH